MAKDIMLGMDAVLYYGSAGATATTELEGVSDVTLKLSKTKVQTSTRRSKFKLTKTALVEASIGFKMPWDEEDANFTALWTAFCDDTPLAFKCMASATSTTGMDADFVITKFDRSEPIEGACEADIEIDPTYSDRDPEFIAS